MKIAYFDYWTKGVSHFKAIDDTLKKKGADTCLLHLGAFRGESEIKSVVDGITCYNITYFKTKLLFKALVQLKPDVLITLNTTSLFDRVVTLTCRALGIKSIFVMHGDRPIAPEDIEEMFAEKRVADGKRMARLSRASRYVKVVLPNYLYTLFRYSPSALLNPKWIKVIYAYYKDLSKANYLPKYTDELINDRCLIFAKEYESYYKHIGYSDENIKIVGNVKYTPLFEKIEKNQFSKRLLPEAVRKISELKQEFAVYFEGAYAEDVDYFPDWDNKYRNELFKLVAKTLNHNNIHLVIKLHPRTDPSLIEAIDNATIIKDCDLDNLIWYSKFCIGHISTCIAQATLLGKAVLTPRWEKSKEINNFWLKNIVIEWHDPSKLPNIKYDISHLAPVIEQYISTEKSGADLKISTAILSLC